MRSPFVAALGFCTLLSTAALAQQRGCPASHYTEPGEAARCSSIASLPLSVQDPFRLARLISPKRKPVRVQPRFGGTDVGWIVKDLKLATKGTSVSANRLNIPGKAQDELEKALKAAGKRDFEKARKHLYAAVAIYPRFSDAIHNLGVIALLEGQEPAAEQLFQQALEYDERNLYPLFALAQIRLGHDDAAEAQRYVERFLTVSPTNPHGLSLLANVQMLQGRYDDALRTFGRLEGMEHKELSAFHLLAGSIFELQQAQGRAIEEYKKYLREAPRAADVAEVKSAIGELQTFVARK